jgi:glycosyltransferase involved in cell wall biosynthesis
MLTLAEGFAGRDIDVSLVLANAKGPYLSQAKETCRIVDLSTGSVWRAIPALIRYLQTEQPDVVVAALEHANAAALLARYAARTRSRVIVTTHTMVSKSLGSATGVRPRGLLGLMRLLYPTADAVIAVSRAVAADLSETISLPRTSIRVVYNPVAIGEVLRMSKARLNSQWFDSSTNPMVLAVGSLWPHKDHKALVNAFSIARQARPMRLVILGEGPERPALQAEVQKLHIQEDVLMPGFARNPYAWMARSSSFVLPSRWEGLPTVLVEAMACGLTPVATDCPGGSSEILEDGKYGFLTPVGDVAAMAEAILESLDRPVTASDLRNRAEAFSVQSAVDKYLTLIVES